MRKLCLSILLLVSATRFAGAQTLAKDIPLTIIDGAGGTQELKFGLASTATDGIDAALGEAELPPLPPAGVFDARFIGTDIGISQLGQGTVKDYRTGTASFSGTQTHELSYQVGSGTTITISWDLPSDVTGLLQDLLGGVVINKSMSGKGSQVIANPGGINKLKMTITYTNPPLPVELVDFRANVIGTDVELTWRTVSETDDYGFEVQRRLTNDEFQKIGFVAGNGSSLKPHLYRFVDKGLPSGVYTYRLKQIDLDGSFTYSAAVEAITSVSPETFELHQNHPNPFNPVTTIEFILGRTQPARLAVYNVLGREVAILFDGQAEAGNFYRLEFDGAQQASGIYFARLRSGERTQTCKMLLSK